MAKFLKFIGYGFAAIIVCFYLTFLFILPKKIDLNVYKSQIQQLVADNTGLNIDFDKVDVITTPWLEAGIKTKNIKVTLPDNSVLFSADSFKGKVFLPSLLWLSVRVSCAEIESPILNVEIINGEKYKVAKVYEDLVNKKRAERRLHPVQELKEPNTFLFDPSTIKLTIPALTLNNYKAKIDDTKANHQLTLKGEKLKLGYFNGKVAKLKTTASFLSDKDENITADLDINTFLPKFNMPPKEEEDDEAVFALPFVNPVSEYRAYNLKSKISSKIKVRKNNKNNKLWAKGYFDVDNTTVTMSGLQLPESYFKLSAKGYKAEIDSNLYVTSKENIKLFGKLSNGKKPTIDFSLKSTQVHFNNLLAITKAYLDTVHIKNDIDNMSADGYMLSNFRLKTDFDNLESDGKFVIRDGRIYDKNIGLLFDKINANLIFDDNVFKIVNTRALINKKTLELSGKIDANSIANVDIKADAIPLPALYLAFAPREIKNSYTLNSGYLTLSARVTGEIKDIAAICKADLEKFAIADKSGNFVMSNKLAHLGVANTAGVIRGKFKNEDFYLRLPNLNSEITDTQTVATIDDKAINIDKSNIKFNKNSNIVFSGKITDYISNPKANIFATGAIATSDLKTVLGNNVALYFDSKGSIPVKASFDSKGKYMKSVVQAQTTANAYITPVRIDDMLNKTLLMQILAEKNDDNIKVYKSGIYLRKPNAEFRDSLGTNLINSKEIVGVRAMLSNLNTKPFINLFKLTLDKELNGSICVFPKSRFSFSGHSNAFGNLTNPKLSGIFDIRNLSIPEVMTTVRNINIDFGSRDVHIALRDATSNSSDFNINMLTTWKLLSEMKFAEVKVYSKMIDVDKLMKVSDALMKSLPVAQSSPVTANSGTSDIPVEILHGNINLKRIKSGNIITNNTTGRIALLKNIFYLNNLKTYPLGGQVVGDVSMNIVSTEVRAKVQGKSFDIKKLLLDLANMKDTLAGNLNFLANVSLKGVTQEEQMKSLKGYVDFNVKKGQLGPFGKFENFLMAENIRNNEFFSSAIGSVITNIVTFDTSHFEYLYGHLTFDNGFMQVAPIKSQGNVMSMYIAGKVGLLDNSADIRVRGKLASAFSDKLGPLANINPINLVKNTPGVNVVLAKTFSVFCQAVSEEEMKAIPNLGKGKTDEYATKFQVVLHGDTRKPLKMIKSFKWLALNSEIENAQNFVDTIPAPEVGEENLSVEELIKLREEQQQAAAETATQATEEVEKEQPKSIFSKLKKSKEKI